MKEKTTKKNLKKRLLIVLGVVIGLLLIAVIGAYLIFDYYYSMMEIAPEDESQEILSSIPPEEEEELSFIIDSGQESEGEEISDEDSGGGQTGPLRNWTSYENNVYNDPNVENILLVGMDSRENNMVGRSDAMIILSINKKTNTITMTSLMRDTLVYIPEVGYDRLNAATAYGGMSLLVRTIEANYNIDIDNYVTTNFFVFVEAIDMMGGVEVELTAAEVKHVNDLMREYKRLDPSAPMSTPLPAEGGKVLLDGQQALAFCRIRKLDSDFGRTARQRKVMLAAINKAKKMGLSEINDIANAILPQIKTNLTQTDCLGYIWDAFTQYVNYDIQTFHLPQSGGFEYGYYKKMAIIYMDFGAGVDEFFEKVYGK